MDAGSWRLRLVPGATTSEGHQIRRPLSRDYLSNNVPMHVGQPVITARVSVCQLGMVEAQQMQDRGVEVVNVDSI